MCVPVYFVSITKNGSLDAVKDLEAKYEKVVHDLERAVNEKSG